MNAFGLIPDSLVQVALEELFNFLSEQAEKYAGEQLSGKIRALSTQATFKESVRKAIKNGAERFYVEFFDTDEALVTAIARKKDIFELPEFVKALTGLICRPGAWQVEKQNQVVGQFNSIFPNRSNRERVNKALSYLLRCITEELWTLPGAKEVRDIYSIKFQQISAEAAREQVEISRKQLEATKQLSNEIRQVMLQLASAMEQKMLDASESTQLYFTRPRPYHNLPRPDYQHFVGREPERAWIR